MDQTELSPLPLSDPVGQAKKVRKRQGPTPKPAPILCAVGKNIANSSFHPLLPSVGPYPHLITQWSGMLNKGLLGMLFKALLGLPYQPLIAK